MPEGEATFKERDGGEERVRDKVEGAVEEASSAKENAKENAKGVVQDAADAGTKGNGSAGTSTGAGANASANASASASAGAEREKARDVDVEDTKERSKQSFKERVTGFKDRIPPQHRDKVTNLVDRAKSFLDEEYFPKERREQFIYRGKKVCFPDAHL